MIGLPVETARIPLGKTSLEGALAEMERTREAYWRRYPRTSPIRLHWRALAVRHAFHGSDGGGKTAAVLLSFIAMCKRNAVEPCAWLSGVLTRIATHPIHRIEELLPH
jgi:hypothetical protein